MSPLVKINVGVKKKSYPNTQSISLKNRSLLMKIEYGRQCIYSKKKNQLNIHNRIYVKEQKYLIDMS